MTDLEGYKDLCWFLQVGGGGGVEGGGGLNGRLITHNLA